MSDEEQRRERWVVSGWWRGVRTLEDVEEQGRLVDRCARRNPGMAHRSDAAIARELLKIVRRSIERRGGPQPPLDHPRGRISIHRANYCRGRSYAGIAIRARSAGLGRGYAGSWMRTSQN